MRSRVLALVTLSLLPNLGLGQESPEQPKSFIVELVDVDGKPVEGANLGLMCSLGGHYPGQTTEWHYNCPAISDAAGSARITAEEDRLKRLCLIARHEGRKISAVTSVDPMSLTEPVKLTLVPECIVTADVICSELAGKFSPGQILDVRHSDKFMLVYVCNDFKIRLSLPPGDYEFEVKGDTTCDLKRPVRVIAAKSQQLEPFDLPSSNLGLIQGRPAPEISDIVGWKNGPAPKLAELRGKVVILDFFGYWCGPCVHEMPKVMALYDKYRDQGLVVIGVHTDLGDKEVELVDTVEKLDARLAKSRAELWEGRDLPFPVALIKSERTRYRDDLPGVDETAPSASAAKYGVMGYPTQILIDRQGNVVGTIYIQAENDIKLLEKTLQDK